MKKCSKCGEIKPRSEFYTAPKSKSGYVGACKECVRLRTNAYKLLYRNRAADRAYYLSHIEEARAAYRRYCQRHPEKNAAHSKAWRGRHPEKAASALAGLKRRYPAAIPAVANRRNARRRAAKRNATPAWANDFFIAEIYDLAQRRAKATGIEWHVDHIVPLRSKLVCGLHVEFNLAVIPAAINHRKSNTIWPDMP